jgi:catechol 2,3-dioxygenase-like lactoylglutathione lyase family enzyme
MRHIKGVVMAGAIAVAAVWPGPQVAAKAGELAASRVTHIGVVVPDIDAALREYSRVMGFSIPKISQPAVPVPEGKKIEFKLATLYMPNFFIEVIQPISRDGPYYEHLQTQGIGIQHMGLALPGTTGSVDDVRSALEQEGGRWVLGSPGVHFAYVNLHAVLGTTLEVIHTPPAEPGPSAAASDQLPPLATLPVGHVGFAATDASAVVHTFAKLLGIPSPKVMEYKDAQYPPQAHWSRTAYLRLAFWSQGGTGIEVIESVGGPTPWSEYVKQHKGTAAQHLAINVGNRMDEMIKDLVAKGGQWTNGKPGGNYAYIDFSDRLGLIFELNGTSVSGGGK